MICTGSIHRLYIDRTACLRVQLRGIHWVDRRRTMIAFPSWCPEDVGTFRFRSGCVLLVSGIWVGVEIRSGCCIGTVYDPCVSATWNGKSKLYCSWISFSFQCQLTWVGVEWRVLICLEGHLEGRTRTLWGLFCNYPEIPHNPVQSLSLRPPSPVSKNSSPNSFQMAEGQ